MNDVAHELLNGQMLCVVATNGADGYPNAASVAFSHTNDFAFVFATDNGTRKAANLERDGRAAMTITDQVAKRTIQIEGTVTKITNEEFDADHAERHFGKLPFARHFRSNPANSFYILKPSSMKLTDINEVPWQVTNII